MSETSANESFLRLAGISKRFGGVTAVDNVDLNVRNGEVLALVGENGAGKSTLMNVVGGVVSKDVGHMAVDGADYDPHTPRDAREAGISFIHQELTLFPSLTVGENIFVGGYPGSLGFIDHGEVYERAAAVLEDLGVTVNVRALVRDLSIGDQQLVEIAKAVSRPVRLIIFDEPTSSLTASEREALFRVIRGLKENGAAVIYISHFLEEIFEISDRVSVMRDGRMVGSLITSESRKEEVIQMMVGRQIRGALTRTSAPSSETVLSVQGVCREGYLDDITFELHRGEILGIWGLLGSGRTELARALFGLDPIDSGRVVIGGTEIQGCEPKKITELGLGYLTESRRDDGLILEMSIRENATLASLAKAAKGPFGKILRKKELDIADDLISRLRIVCAGADQEVQYLSGGNQQKVVLAKWLSLAPRAYILDEPTRGVDVGAKDEIHRIILSLAEEGSSIVLISSEMEEIMRLSDRILVMHRGKIRGQVSPDSATQETLVQFTTGGD